MLYVIKKKASACHLVARSGKATVRVHEYPDGHLAVYWGPRRLADYGADGVLIRPAADAIAGIVARDVG